MGWSKPSSCTDARWISSWQRRSMVAGVPLPPSAGPLFRFAFVRRDVGGGSLIRAWTPPTSSYPEVTPGLHLLPCSTPSL